MKETVKLSISFLLALALVFCAALMTFFLKLDIAENDPFSFETFASTNSRVVVSYSPASGNLDTTDAPSGNYTFYYGESPYFNLICGKDVYCFDATLYIYKEGTLYKTSNFSDVKAEQGWTYNWFHYWAMPIQINAIGTFSFYFEITYNTAGSSSSVRANYTSGTGNFQVIDRTPVLRCNVDSVNLNAYSNKTQTISFWNNENLSYNTYYQWDKGSTSAYSCSWGDWADGKCPLTITANRRGNYTLTVRMKKSSDDSTVSTKNISINISAPAYTVSYNANGGSGAPSSQTKYYNEDLTLSSIIPEKFGETFAGWSTSSSGSVSYNPGDPYTSNSGITLYAKWNANYLSLSNNSFNVNIPNGGEVKYYKFTPSTSGEYTIYSSGSIDSCVQLYNADGSIPGQDQYKNDSYDDDDGEGTNFSLTYYLTAGTTYYYGVRCYDASATGTIPVVFNKKSNIPTYTISYNANGGSGAPGSQIKYHGTDVFLSNDTPSKTVSVTFDGNGGSVSTSWISQSSTFKNWNTASGGGGSNYSSGTRYQKNESLPLYAQWTDKSLTLPTPTRRGYTFLGWFTSGGTKVGNAGDTYTPASSITLYAHWTANTYVVHFNGNGATSGTMPDQRFTYDVSQKLTENAFKRAFTVTYNYNYSGKSNTGDTAMATFNGWAKTATGSKTYEDQQPVSNLTTVNNGTVTLYAKWTDGSVTLPMPANRANYVFSGWYTAASGGTKVGNSGEKYTPTANVTLYANWSSCSHTWNSGTVTKTATCTAAGVTTYTCTVCKATKTEPLPPPLGHDYTKQSVSSAALYKGATCTAKAKYYYSCSRCGVVEQNANHTFESGNVKPHSYTGEVKNNGSTHSYKCVNGCGQYGNATAHTWNSGNVTTQPTCTAAGVTTYTCTACKATKTGAVPPPLGHDYTKQTVSSAAVYKGATCTAKAKYYYSCSRCGAVEKNASHTFESGNVKPHSYTGEAKNNGSTHSYKCVNGCGQYGNATAHTWNSGKVTTQPTCTAAGVTTYSCTACKATKTGAVPPPLGHDYTKQTVSSAALYKGATCTAKAKYYYSCSRCGVVEKNANHTFESGNEKPHSYTGEVKNNGSTHSYKCVNGCGQYGNATAHTWNSGKVTTPPTCTAAGVTTYTCTTCKATKTEPIPAALGHDYTKQTVSSETLYLAATCTAKAKYYYSCARPGCTVIEKKSSHTFESGNVNAANHAVALSHTARKEATCLAAGNVEYWYCSKCGNYYGNSAGTTKLSSISIPKKDHSYTGEAKNNGSTHSYKCVNGCGQYGNATAHTWNSGKVTTQPTCTATGVRTYTCIACKATKTETIKATGHDYGAWKKLSDTEHQRECANNSNHKETAKHTWNSGAVTKEPTCTATGVRTFTCTGCKATKTETIKAKGHSYGAWKKLSDTQHQRVCSRCKTVQNADHTWNAGTITKQPTATATGVKTYACTECGGERTRKLYLVIYNAGAGTGAPAAQFKEQGIALKLRGEKPTLSYKVTYNANGGKVSPASKTVTAAFAGWKDGKGTAYSASGAYTADASVTLTATWTNPKAGALPSPTYEKHSFVGWFTAKDGGAQITKDTVIEKSQTLYAHWKTQEYTVTYNANGGSGAPSKQIKKSGQPLKLSGKTPTKSYTLTYNAAGGTVSPASVALDCGFLGWNTKADGSGTPYRPGTEYKVDADLVLYAQWSNPKAGDGNPDRTMARPMQRGYQFEGWFTKETGGVQIAVDSIILSNTTVYAHWSKTPAFTWGKDNWNFINDYPDFKGATYREHISKSYQTVLANQLSNCEYESIFGHLDKDGKHVNGMIDSEWKGSCYGMSVTSVLAKQGMLVYSDYQQNAQCLAELSAPAKNEKVSSLITYYHLLQKTDAIQQQIRSPKNHSNKNDIETIISLLKKNDSVVVCYYTPEYGGHAVVAYGYSYGSYSYGNVTYQGCIRVCDPNAPAGEDENRNIYFNTTSYKWTIPAYCKGNNANDGKYFLFISADGNLLNHYGYLYDSARTQPDRFIARIDAMSIGENRRVEKVKPNGPNSYGEINSGPDDIVEDYSYSIFGENEGVFGYNLRDADSSYRVKQNASPMDLYADFASCDMRCSSELGTRAVFDPMGHIEIEGENADYSMRLTFDDNYPTSWYAVGVSGSAAKTAGLQKGSDGYILSADVLQDVTVTVNNREIAAEVSFSFPDTVNQVLIYEVNPYTVGIKVDNDGDGVFETTAVIGEPSEQNTALLGDVDQSGDVTSADARLALRAAVGLENYAPGSVEFIAADVDRSGSIESSDARSILRAAVGLETLQ